MGRYILSHDIGTSSDKAVLVDFDGNITAMSTWDYPTYYPQPAWVEQDPEDYWQAVCRTSRAILEDTGIRPEEIRGIVFSTQAQGVIPVDREGNVLYNNITWVDGRAQAQAERIMRRVGGKRLFTLFAGTPIMGKDCIAKITWLKEERPDIYEKTDLILDVNGYLKFKCTGEKVTELSGASSYGLDLKKKEWLSVFPLVGIDMDRLPPLVASTDIVGGLTARAAEETGLAEGTPVFGGCDDVQAAVVGSGMCGDGDVHIYLGTSAWVCASSRDQDKFKHGAAAIQSADRDMNLIAGITESAGANIQWLCDQFFAKEKEEYGEEIFAYMDKVVESIPPGSDHLICTPWMLGERCPVSSTTTRATLFNINMVHTREHMMRAVYEGIGYNLRWILENYQKDYGFDCNDFRIIGGGALDEAWMQIIADITGKRFSVVADPRNAGAVGAAMIALIGLGHLASFADTKDFVKVVRTYTPNGENAAIYDKLFEDYKNIYKGLASAYDKANGERFEGAEEDGPETEEPAADDLTAQMQRYAGKLSDLPYPVTKGTLLLKVEDLCLKTADNADLSDLKEDDLVDATHFSLPEKDVLLKKRGAGAMILASAPYIARCLENETPVEAGTDDFAQIIGPEAEICPREEKALQKALSKSSAVLVRDGGEGFAVVAGRTLYEAFTAFTVLEKAAEMQCKGEALGGIRPVSPRLARAEQIVYRRKYSKAEDTHQKGKDSKPKKSRKAPDPSFFARTAAVGQDLADTGRRLQERGLVQGTWGNLSVRAGGSAMLVTPSGLDYDRLTAGDMVEIDLTDQTVTGLHKPTSEADLHAGIYLAHREAGAVIHTHSKYCSIYAACHMPLEVEDPEKWKLLGDLIPIAPYGISGSRKLAKQALDAMGDARGVILTNHGAVCWGRTLEECFTVCEQMEEAAKEAIERRWKNLNTPLD